MTTIVQASSLKEFIQHVLRKINVPDHEAVLASEVLLSADLGGIDSHGIARLSGYVRLWEKDRINSIPEVRVIHETFSTATIDGDRGLGLVVAPKAMQIAIDKAK